MIQPKAASGAAPPTAFVDYYNAHNIIPVSQDVAAIDLHLFRREYLYRTLGVPPALLAGRDIIEFGPGGGYNAIATCRWAPRSCTFVDASTASLAQLRHKEAQRAFGVTAVRIREASFLDYQDPDRYLLVVCEGAIPGQVDPAATLRHLASFCAPGGFVVITTMSATSLLSEICRRVLRPAVAPPEDAFEAQTRSAAVFFSPHLATLRASTRPVEDWVQDVILHDWTVGTYVFTMLDALDALGNAFDFHASSPRFLDDDRWYKGVGPGAARPADLLRAQYPLLSAALIDYRIGLDQVRRLEDTGALAAIEDLSAAACRIHDQMYRAASLAQADEFARVLTELARTLPPVLQITREAIGDYLGALARLADGQRDVDWGRFPHWWGRGQQYLALASTVR